MNVRGWVGRHVAASSRRPLSQLAHELYATECRSVRPPSLSPQAAAATIISTAELSAARAESHRKLPHSAPGAAAKSLPNDFLRNKSSKFSAGASAACVARYSDLCPGPLGPYFSLTHVHILSVAHSLSRLLRPPPPQARRWHRVASAAPRCSTSAQQTQQVGRRWDVTGWLALTSQAGTSAGGKRENSVLVRVIAGDGDGGGHAYGTRQHGHRDISQEWSG